MTRKDMDGLETEIVRMMHRVGVLEGEVRELRLNHGWYHRMAEQAFLLDDRVRGNAASVNMEDIMERLHVKCRELGTLERELARMQSTWFDNREKGKIAEIEGEFP